MYHYGPSIISNGRTSLVCIPITLATNNINDHSINSFLINKFGVITQRQKKETKCGKKIIADGCESLNNLLTFQVEEEDHKLYNPMENTINNWDWR